MVLEILVNPKKVSGKPWEMYFIGVVYSMAAALLSFWIFKRYSSIIMIALVAIAAVPFIHAAIVLEEKKAKKKHHLLKEHAGIVSMFTYFFLGCVTVFTFLYLVLPGNFVGTLFESQIETITSIQYTPTGNFISAISTLGKILSNNIGLLFICLIFSFFYGVGAILILAWNASVMGVAIGSAISSGLQISAGNSFLVVSSKLTGYFLHGIPEIMAYFIAALAGGIISVALVKESFAGKTFRCIALDSLHLVSFAVLLLVLSALLEVFVSPAFLIAT